MKTMWPPSLKKYLTTPVALMVLASLGLEAQDVSPRLPPPPALPENETIIIDRPPPPLLPENIKSLHTPSNEALEQEIKKTFEALQDRRETGKYWDLRSAIDLFKKNSTPENYPPKFVEDFDKNQCIKISDLTKELNKLTKELSENQNLDTTLQAVTNYENLFKKDLNRRYKEICFLLPTDKADDEYETSLKDFKTIVSQSLIKELTSLKDYGKINEEVFQKAQKISIALKGLFDLSHGHSISCILPQFYRIRPYDFTAYLAFNHFPEVNQFFQKEILPEAMKLESITNGDSKEIEKLIKYIDSVFLPLNTRLNWTNNTDDSLKFFANINSQLLNTFISATLEQDETKKETALTNLEKLRSALSTLFVKRNLRLYDPFPKELEALIQTSLGASQSDKELYYKALEISLDNDSYKELNINGKSLETIRKDLASVIEGSCDQKTKLKLKNFLAQTLVSGISKECFNGNFKFFIKQASLKITQQQKSLESFSNPRIPLLDLMEVALNPDFMSNIPKLHPSKAIAAAFDFSKIAKGQEPNVSHLIELNKRYLKAINFLEEVFWAGNLQQRKIPEFTPGERVDKINLAYADLQRALHAQFSIENQPNADFRKYIDVFFYGRAYGHFLESQLVPDDDSELKQNSPQNYHSVRDGLLQARMPLPQNLIENTAINKFLKKHEISFLLGALTAIPNIIGHNINLKERLENRLNLLLLREPYSDNNLLFSKEIRDLLIGEAIKLIIQGNPDIQFTLDPSSVETVTRN